jgi:multiple sugar transport system substrate-binding protein
LFAPLDEYMQQAPIEEWDDIFEGLRASLEIDGSLYGVPMRAGTDGAIIYNKAIFRERGVEELPETWEELVALAEELTFTRADGEKVYGLVDIGVKQEAPFSLGRWIRTRNGDFMTLDYEVVVNSPEVVETLEEYKALYDAGALGPNWNSQTNSDRINIFRNGRAAMIGAGADYVGRLSGDDGIPREDIGVFAIPPAEGYDVTHPIVFQWAFVIPQGSENKDAAWELIRYMSSQESTLQMALSGNAPVRASTFENPEFTGDLAYDPDVKLSSLQNGRILFPGFDNFPEARDFLGEQIQKIVLGEVGIEEGLQTAQERLEDLAPDLE